MANEIGVLIAELSTKDDVVRKSALDKLMALSERRVDWIYDHLDTLCAKLEFENSFQRNIGAMLIANLAKSDIQGKLESVISCFIARMDDEKFITARITLQAAWRFGIVNESYAKHIAVGLVDSLIHNRHLSTHGNLIRLDAVTSLCEIIKVYPYAADIGAARSVISESCDAKEAMKLFSLLEGVQ